MDSPLVLDDPLLLWQADPVLIGADAHFLCRAAHKVQVKPLIGDAVGIKDQPGVIVVAGDLNALLCSLWRKDQPLVRLDLHRSASRVLRHRRRREPVRSENAVPIALRQLPVVPMEQSPDHPLEEMRDSHLPVGRRQGASGGLEAAAVHMVELGVHVVGHGDLQVNQRSVCFTKLWLHAPAKIV